MHSEAYDNYDMGPLHVGFSFRFEPYTSFLCHVLVSVMVLTFCFQVPMMLPFSLVGAQPFGFVTLWPFRVYSWQAYMPHDDSLWPMLGVHWVAAPSNALSRAELFAAHSADPSHSINMVGHSFGGSSGSLLIPLPSPHGRELSFFPGSLHPVTQ